MMDHLYWPEVQSGCVALKHQMSVSMPTSSNEKKLLSIKVVCVFFNRSEFFSFYKLGKFTPLFDSIYLWNLSMYMLKVVDQDFEERALSLKSDRNRSTPITI